MAKLTNAEKDKLDNTCGNLRVTKLGTHVKSLEDFVNQGVLATRANDVTAAINELYGMIVNNDCATIQIPPPGFFTLFGNDEDGKLYVYYNNEDYPPVFQHIEDEEDDLNGTLYLYIADPQGENHYQMEIGHYIAVSHLDDYYTKTESNTRFGITVEKQAQATTGYAETYVVKQNGVQVGAKINIPKDFFTKGGSVKTCTVANTPVQGFNVGDKYLDLEINVDDGGATTKHMYILLKDLGQIYAADESTLTLSNANVFSVKNGGITMAKLSAAVQEEINNKAGAGSFTYQKVNVLVDKPTGTVDDTVYYLTVTDSNFSGHEPGFYIWDYDKYIPFHKNGKEDKSNKVTSISSSSTNTQYPSAKLLFDQLALKQDSNTAFSGDYNDLTNKPSIPSKTSDLTNDSGFITSHQDITGKEDKSNKVTSLSNQSTDNQYPSAKLLFDQLALKQDSNTAFSGDYDDLTNKPSLFSGDYDDLTNKPSIPSKTSDLSNDSGFLTSHQDITGKEDKSNKVSSWSNTPTDTHYPSEKLVKDNLDTKLNDIMVIFDINNITVDGIYILDEFVLSTQDQTYIYGNDNKFYASVMSAGAGNPFAVGEKVTFNLAGIEYQRTIDQYGTAILNIHLMAGEYTITTTFRDKTNTNTITINP